MATIHTDGACPRCGYGVATDGPLAGWCPCNAPDVDALGRGEPWTGPMCACVFVAACWCDVGAPCPPCAASRGQAHVCATDAELRERGLR